MTNRATENLALLDVETQRLLATCADLQDAARPSLCEGWDVAHVLTHLARNADGLINMVLWAVDGQERAVYASDERRAADIVEGARRPLPEIVADVETTAARFREQAQQLTGPAGEALVRTRTGNTVAGHQVIAMRILEVVFHHVDLDAGYTFDDADPEWVARTLRRGVRQWEAAAGTPSLTLRPEGMAPLDLAGGGTEVEGTAGQLLLWLARGRTEGLSATVDLPQPPPWA
ncbi:maleylpyruvate isomerase family mycothiol-dependent enzyme [Ornithinimicrobium pratense]|uniref:Maleylpyruvate isomerase family mycothiol-dependent enzyme n=1 Tax=Ornithinimicrobium pratense TaxID=2593973 RepID=A0A5J6V455_9MICO|nr:maleylpyruvate isomerase family mycothiol-dependent enzyme [Ornithinimicrobium pratense]QFG68525.1 maleylpyruvate isomerase family mycothiol-dependent enzyme [Ornithinimicrobium pratense]